MKTILFISAIVGTSISMVYFVFKGLIPYLSYQNTKDERKIDSIQAMLKAFILFGASILIMYFLQ